MELLQILAYYGIGLGALNLFTLGILLYYKIKYLAHK